MVLIPLVQPLGGNAVADAGRAELDGADRVLQVADPAGRLDLDAVADEGVEQLDVAEVEAAVRGCARALLDEVRAGVILLVSSSMSSRLIIHSLRQ